MKTVRRILRYIKGSPGKGLWFKSNRHLRIEGYYDANWTCYVDNLGLQLDIVYILEAILWLGGARNKLWLSDLRLRQSIDLWH
jgi:hypothetical protein